jgi:hypothetical protein
VAKTEEYTLTDTAILWPGGSLPFAHIKTVRIYSVPGIWIYSAGRSAFGSNRCVITLDSGAAIQLTSHHYLSLGNFEDRSPAFFQFVSALVARVRAANPVAQIVSGMPPMLWWFWFLSFGLLALLLILSIALGLLGLTLEHKNSLGTSLLFLALAGLLIGPIGFLRAIWRRRTRDLNSGDLYRAV